MEAELFLKSSSQKKCFWCQNMATISTVLFRRSHTDGMFGEKLSVVVKNNHTTGKRMLV